jgi:hypothetical protein
VARERQAEQRPDAVADPAAWTHRFSRGPLNTAYLSTSPLSEAGLLDRLRTAQHRQPTAVLVRRKRLVGEFHPQTQRSLDRHLPVAESRIGKIFDCSVPSKLRKASQMALMSSSESSQFFLPRFLRSGLYHWVAS